MPLGEGIEGVFTYLNYGLSYLVFLQTRLMAEVEQDGQALMSGDDRCIGSSR